MNDQRSQRQPHTHPRFFTLPAPWKHVPTPCVLTCVPTSTSRELLGRGDFPAPVAIVRPAAIALGADTMAVEEDLRPARAALAPGAV